MGQDNVGASFVMNIDTVSNEDARAILFNINRIQENVIDHTLSIAKLRHLFKSNPSFGSFEEAFPWCPGGLTMLFLMINVKKTLFAKFYPDLEYGASNFDQIFKQ
jgi:hypothetical protein